MEYEKIKEWMDEVVNKYIELQGLEGFNNQICLCEDFCSIQVYKGINILADVMGLKLEMRKRSCKAYPYEYSFTYRGVEFVQLSGELAYAGTD